MTDNELLNKIARIWGTSLQCGDPDCLVCPENQKNSLTLIAAFKAEVKAEASQAARNHAEVFYRRLVTAQDALLKYPSIVTRLVRDCYGIQVNETQIAAWMEKELAASLTSPVIVGDGTGEALPDFDGSVERQGAPVIEVHRSVSGRHYGVEVGEGGYNQ